MKPPLPAFKNLIKVMENSSLSRGAEEELCHNNNRYQNKPDITIYGITTYSVFWKLKFFCNSLIRYVNPMLPSQSITATEFFSIFKVKYNVKLTADLNKILGTLKRLYVTCTFYPFKVNNLQIYDQMKEI